MKELKFDNILMDVISCKWSPALLKLIDQNVNRPGQIEKQLQGISTKVMNESLRRLVAYKLLSKTTFDETPPKVIYSITNLGKDSLVLLDLVEELRKKYSQVNVEIDS